jgi:hypothetical protein
MAETGTGDAGDAGGSGPTQAPDAGTDASADGDAYGGLPGAFLYAFRRSDSALFRAYVLLGGGLAALLAVLFGIALIVTVANSLGAAAGSGTFSFVRAFVLFVGLLVVFPLVAPVVLVARRHRRRGSTVAYDRALATGGFLVAAGLYLGAVLSRPAGLFGLPRTTGLLPPLLAALAIYALHRRYR